MAASRFIGRAGALALAVGLAIALSAQPTVTVPAAKPENRSHRVLTSGGWVGAITAILVAWGRRPSAMFRRGRRPSGTAIPVSRSDVDDTPAGTVRTVTGIGPVHDIALSADGRYAYVATSSADGDVWTVTVVDTATNSVVTTIDDLKDVVPPSLAVSPDSSRLYVADSNAAAIRVVDITEGSPTRNRLVDSLRLEGSLPIGYGTPSSIALSPTGSRLYALMTEPAVLIVDPAARVLLGAVSGGDSVAMFPAGERIYVCAGDRLGHPNVTAGVVILDADTGRGLGSFGLSDAPAFIRQPILASGAGQLYLDIDDLDGRLEVVDTSTLNVVERIKIDAAMDPELRSIPAAAVLSPDGRRLYVANQGVRLSDEATEVGWISVVDTRLNEVIRDIALPDSGTGECLGASPQFITISPAGDRLVVVNEYGIASVIDIESTAVVSTVPLGKPTDQPRVVVVNPARNTVYVGGDCGLTVVPL